MIKWEDKEFIDMMSEVNKKGCVTHIKGYEPMYEEEHINKVVLPYYSDGDWQAFVETLVCNEYEVTVKVRDDDVVITWKDKQETLLDWLMNDPYFSERVEETKREARKTGEMTRKE